MKRSKSLNTDIAEMCRAAATCTPLGSSLAACGGGCTGTPACGEGRTGSGGYKNIFPRRSCSVDIQQSRC
jgi:hypothetical protein